MESGLSISLSGIQSAISRQNIVANDIANINTNHYAQVIPNQTESMPTGTKISNISRPQNDGIYSNASLAKETTNQIINKHTLSANIKVAKTQSDMIGEIIDLKG